MLCNSHAFSKKKRVFNLLKSSSIYRIGRDKTMPDRAREQTLPDTARYPARCAINYPWHYTYHTPAFAHCSCFHADTPFRFRCARPCRHRHPARCISFCQTSFARVRYSMRCCHLMAKLKCQIMATIPMSTKYADYVTSSLLPPFFFLLLSG